MRVQEGVQRRRERDAVARRRDRDRDRIGDGPSQTAREPLERRAWPGGAGRLDEGRPCAVVSRWRSFDGANAAASSATARSAGVVLRAIGRVGMDENTASQKPPPSPITIARASAAASRHP